MLTKRVISIGARIKKGSLGERGQTREQLRWQDTAAKKEVDVKICMRRLLVASAGYLLLTSAVSPSTGV